MRDIIGERPNLTPIGLGNSQTEVDLDNILDNKSGSGQESSLGADEAKSDKGVAELVYDDEDKVAASGMDKGAMDWGSEH